MFHWLKSPVAGTAGVVVGLCLISIPLRKLTSAPPVVAIKPSKAEISADTIPAVLRVKLLAPAKQLRLENSEGEILLDKKNLDAGESEHDVALSINEGELDITLHADFGALPTETAIFLTVIPDGHEELIRFATGSGVLDETLHYEWPHAH